MARVVVTDTARSDLATLIESRELPESAIDRVRSDLRRLETFPRIGHALIGRWAGIRVILGPWPWMLVLYRYDEQSDTATVLSIQDARAAGSATSDPVDEA